MAHLNAIRKLQSSCGLRKQSGAALLLVVMILIVMSTMIFFNARITAYEQIISGNDRRSKLATHAAEAGVAHAMRFFSRGIRQLSLSLAYGEDYSVDWLPGEEGAVDHWLPCADVEDPLMMPCAAAPTAEQGRADGFVRENVFYYVEDASAETLNTYLPISALSTQLDESDEPVARELYRVQALLCAIDYDQDTFDPDDAATLAKCSSTGTPSGINVAIKVVSTGYADANQEASGGGAEAIITRILANVEPGGGPPQVPIMSYNSLSPTGTFTVVAAPNGGGLGVPVSVWSRHDAKLEVEDISSGDRIATGSFSSCELEEYLRTRDSAFWREWTDAQGVTYVTCDSCLCPDKEADGAMSHTPGFDPGREYFDIVDNDPEYPDDIFEYYFGVARTEYRQVRDGADTILPDCSTIDTTLTGLVWIDGYCNLAGKEVSSATNPVALVTTKGVSMNGNTILYGALVITDPTIMPEDQVDGSIPVSLVGGPVVYGAVLNDPGSAALAGSFTVVYIENILKKIHPLIMLGNLSGSWSDQETFQ